MSESNIWKSVEWQKLCDDPAFYLGQVAMGAAFTITAEDEMLALLIPPPKLHSASPVIDQT